MTMRFRPVWPPTEREFARWLFAPVDPPYRPERLVVATDVARELAEDGLRLESVEHHADGTSTVTFAPDDDDEESEC